MRKSFNLLFTMFQNSYDFCELVTVFTVLMALFIGDGGKGGSAFTAFTVLNCFYSFYWPVDFWWGVLRFRSFLLLRCWCGV